MGQEQAIRFFLKDENDIMSISLLRNELKHRLCTRKGFVKAKLWIFRHFSRKSAVWALQHKDVSTQQICRFWE